MKRDVKFLLSNCRSVILKTESILDMFENCDNDFAILTETWTNEGNQARIEEDFRKGKGLNVLMSSREGKRGGGLAVVFRQNKLSFTKHDFFTGQFEILAVKCKIEVAQKNLFVIATYYPPSMKASDVEKMNELICDEVLKIKLDYKDPFIIIAGDMNKKNCAIFSDDFADIRIIDSPPTRQGERLDLCFSNCKFSGCTAYSPVWSNEGTESDHLSLCYGVCFEGKKFTYESVVTRKVTKRGEDEFCSRIRSEDWEAVTRATTACEKVTELHSIVERYKAVCFPLKKSRIRSDEDPWINDYVRRRIRVRNRIFSMEKRSHRWRTIRDEIRLEMKRLKKAYYEREVDKICNSRDKRSLAYTALKNINNEEKPKVWNITEMCPNRPLEETLEELADFFNNVTNEYESVRLEDIPRTFDRPIYALTADMVEERIRKSKKPNSQVPGDFPPQLLTTLAPEIAGVVTGIFNMIPNEVAWPREWKKEFQTIIPKKKAPESFDQLRNLSCTNFLSKIMESFVVDSIKNEIELSDLQYGGLKGCGTDNFLIELWNNVMEAAENRETVTALMSVDFSKAFNRLDHTACLRKMAEKNASNQTLRLVFSFLSKREMCVRSGQTRSTLRKVRGGSPQGTKLGNLLFCIAVDDICQELAPTGILTPERVGGFEEEEEAFPEQYSPRVTSTPVRNFNDSFNPNPFGLRRKINVINDTASFNLLPEEDYLERDTWEIGYIDDINICETISVSESTLHLTVNKAVRRIRAKGCERKYAVIKENGEALRLKLNPAKTQLICFSGNRFCETICYASIENRMQESMRNLKILGFCFNGELNVECQVKSLVKKFNSSVWSLVHLKKNLLDSETLIRVYKSMIRPIVEYSSNVYHAMLTREHANMIERCQRKAMKIVYGFEISYAEALEKAGLPTLEERRVSLFMKFCLRMSENERFKKKWLPTRSTGEEEMLLRKRKCYLEFQARTKRLFDSPIFLMRRVLNSL